MKINTILVAGACAGILFTTSCQPSMKERQLKYTHTTQVDGDAFLALQTVGEKVPYETDYASYVESNSSVGENRALAAKVKTTLGEMIVDLDTLATRYKVNFPIRGAKQFQAAKDSQASMLASDSTAVTQHDVSEEHYAHHVQHEVAEIKKHFDRLSRNTNKDLRDYAASKLEVLNTLYKDAGGKEEAGAHH